MTVSAWLDQALAGLAASPTLQGLALALATFVLEDPATVGAGLLVADRQMAFATALIGLAAGIAIGDVGLYGIGRLVGPRVIGWGPITPQRVDRATGWFRRNLFTAIVLARFVPGMRLPTYVAAGALRAPAWRFATIAVGASLVWTVALLSATAAVGHAVLPVLGSYRWPVALAAVALLVVAQRRGVAAVDRDADLDASPRSVVSRFEFWPPWLFYIPVAVHWMWLALRHRGLLLPTAANPTIYGGGFIGESKSQILDLVPESQQRWVARYTVLSRPAGAGTEELLRQAREEMASARIAYPVVAKPDVGQRGDGVQPIRCDHELGRYLTSFPADERLVLQELVGDGGGDGPREAGVLYIRRPGEPRGSIFSITLKSLPAVVGDGQRTIRQLIEADPRARRITGVYFKRHADRLDDVPAPGERFELVFAGNHCQGAVFTDGTHLATPELVDRIDTLARAMPEFWFGRFDVRFDDLARFLQGTDLKIVEINGASGEATHIWDASMRLNDAYRTLFAQFRALFEIGAANRRRGHRPLGVVRFLQDVLRYRRMARQYPPTR